MSHLTPSRNRKPSVLSKRISAAGFGAMAAAAFILSSGSAQAGPTEQKAIQAELNKLSPIVYLNPKPGQPAASGGQIEDAIKAVLENPKNKKLKPGVLVGEALKSLALKDQDGVGTEFGQALTQILAITPAEEVLGTVVGEAAKTAGAGKGAVLTHLSPFVAEALSSDTEVLAAAKAAASSNTVVAAIFAGRASELNDAQRLDLVKSAVTDKSAAKAIVEISRDVSAQVSDVASFAEEVSAKLIEAKKTSTILKLVPGIVSLNVEDASAITEKLLNSSNAQATTLKTTVVKGLATYAKNVAAVADIEQISEVGAQLALQIGANGNKTSVASGLAKTLASAIFAKPSSQVATLDNRLDEVGEVAAYVVGGILNNTALQAKNYKSLESTVLGIIKSAISGSAPKDKALKTELAAVKDQLIKDIVGSVSLTLGSAPGISTEVKDRVYAYLFKNAKGLAGKSTDLKAGIEHAIDVAFGKATDNDLLNSLENGLEFGAPPNRGSTFYVGSLVDAETDVRNF